MTTQHNKSDNIPVAPSPCIQADWHLVTSSNPVCTRPRHHPDGFHPTGTNIFLPLPDQLTKTPIHIRALLPIHNYNQNLVNVLQHCDADAFNAVNLILGVFMADNFLPMVDIQQQCQRLGITTVTNLPAVSGYGLVIEKTLADVALGFEKELQVLENFRRKGFNTVTVVSSVEQKKSAMKAENQALIELALHAEQTEFKVFSDTERSEHPQLIALLLPDGRFHL